MVVTVVMGISLVDEEISAISSLGVCVVWCVGVCGSVWECVGCVGVHGRERGRVWTRVS